MIYIDDESHTSLWHQWCQDHPEESVLVKKDMAVGLSGSANDLEILVTGSRLDEARLAPYPGLRWIHWLSAGVDNVPLPLLKARGIALSNSRGVHGRSIAEQAMGMMMMFTRGLHVNLRNQQHHAWVRGYPLDELTSKHLLVVGAGGIAREVARKAKAFDMVVTGIRRHPQPMPSFDRVLPMERWEEAVPSADYVLILTPLVPSTRHMVGTKVFAAMKTSAILLNFARGAIVDQSALIRALQDRQIAGAGLDVFEQEPLPADDALWDMENVLISPHNGGGSAQSGERLVATFSANFVAYRSGAPLPTTVDLHEGY